MNNLIKSEFYRMLKSKCTLIMLIVTAGFSALIPLLYKLVFSLTGVKDYGVNVFEFTSLNISGCFLLIFEVIFIAIFISGESKNGFIKGILSYVGKRRKLALANYIIVEIVLLAIFIVSILVSSIVSLILFSETEFGFTLSVLKYLAIEFLLHSAFAAFMMFLSYLVRSTAFSLTMGILAGTGTFSMILSLISTAIISTYDVDSDFSLVEYTISGAISSLSESANDPILLPILIGIVGIILYLGLASLLLEKKDIK